LARDLLVRAMVSTMRRRTFLGVMGGAASAAALLRSRRAEAFGEFPAGAEAAQLPAGVRAKKVLEIFLYGGVSPWETLYYVPTYGTATDPQYPNTQYYAYKTDSDAMIGTCQLTAGPQPFATDALGASVELGPFAARLYARTDITSRMRIVVQKHALEPHEAAVPQALTGRPVGQPTAAGLGAHIQRARLDAGSTQAAPHAYVFATAGSRVTTSAPRPRPVRTRARRVRSSSRPIARAASPRCSGGRRSARTARTTTRSCRRTSISTSTA
jgi:hypothetical protein